MKYKNLAALSLSSVLALGVFATDANAINPNEVNEPEKMVKISALDFDMFSKDELIERFHELFPGKYDFLTDRDFHMDFYRYPFMGEDEDVRVYLSFHKQMSNNQYFNGHVQFVGDDLELESFYIQPLDRKEAMYPPKVSMDEAKEVAKKFVANFADSKNYRLKERDNYSSYWGNRTLTDPIEYSFVFEKLHNGTPVMGQEMQVTVLGSGELVNFYSGHQSLKNTQYEQKTNLLSESDVVEKLEANLQVELRYVLDYRYYSNDAEAKLVYVPVPPLQGVNAKDGKWLVYGEFVDKLPPISEPKMLADAPKSVTENPLTKDEARKLAESLLQKESSEGKLYIDGVREERRGDLELFSVQYSYRTEHGGYGSSIDINKNTGEVLSFYDMVHYDSRNEIKVNVNYDQALERAVKAIEKFSPSVMHEYSYPVHKDEYYRESGVYSFHFPLVKNGVLVEGGGIHVGISTDDGRVINFSSMNVGVDSWPDPKDAVSNEAARAAFLEDLNVELYYQNLWNAENRGFFHLVYNPVFNGRYASFDAIKGEWIHERDEARGVGEYPHLEGHWAADQILYLLESNIISERDADKLMPNEAVSKGRALEVLVKSLSYVPQYNYYYYEEDARQSFTNVDSDHELYNVVERAVQMGILSNEGGTLDLDEKVSREQLAVWYIKALRLGEAGKHHNIYTVPFADKASITKENLGYVALGYALGIFQGDSTNKFNPNQEVTLGQLAVSAFRMAEKAADINDLRYYY